MEYTVRPIEKRDNAAVEAIIRYCLTEFGAAHEGTAWADPNLGRFSEIYGFEGSMYWVAEDENGRIVGGAGIGPLPEAPGVCELQKMYCLPEARGTGAAHELMDRCLVYAREHYEKCYLETLESMKAAQRFYERYGFIRIPERMGNTGHYNCEVMYYSEL